MCNLIQIFLVFVQLSHNIHWISGLLCRIFMNKITVVMGTHTVSKATTGYYIIWSYLLCITNPFQFSVKAEIAFNEVFFEWKGPVQLLFESQIVVSIS